jgi:hypothetical protein
MLQKINISGPALKLLSSFIRDRSQFVVLEQIASDRKPIRSGVPQGSILGPLLFLIYINGILKLNIHSYIQLYADDAVLVVSATSFSVLMNKMSEDLSLISNWLQSIGLTLNTSKSKFLIIRKINTNTSDIFQTVHFQDSSITSCSHYNYLGLVVDENLNWQLHLKKVCSKLSSFAYIFRKVRYHINANTLKQLYYAYVHSHLTYLIPIWGSCPTYYFKNLQFLQNKILKIITFKRFDTPTVDLYNNEVLSVHQQYIYESIFNIFKMFNGFLKTNFNLTTNIQITGVSTRSSALIRLPSFRTASAQKTPFYKGVDLFNRLPSQIKNITSISIFKRRLKEYVFQHFPVIRSARRDSV